MHRGLDSNKIKKMDKIKHVLQEYYKKRVRIENNFNNRYYNRIDKKVDKLEDNLVEELKLLINK